MLQEDTKSIPSVESAARRSLTPEGGVAVMQGAARRSLTLEGGVVVMQGAARRSLTPEGGVRRSSGISREIQVGAGKPFGVRRRSSIKV